MKIHLIQAEHFSQPGLVIKGFATEAQSVAEAVELTNIMLKDHGWQPLASPVQWQHHVARLQEEHDDECYVEITELEIADPARDAAPDMLAALRRFEAVFGSILEANDELPGADAVDALAAMWPAIRAAIAKAEGGTAPATVETAQSLEARYGRWQDHPDYSDRDWRNDETRLGYWEWVASKVNGQEGGAA